MMINITNESLINFLNEIFTKSLQLYPHETLKNSDESLKKIKTVPITPVINLLCRETRLIFLPRIAVLHNTNLYRVYKSTLVDAAKRVLLNKDPILCCTSNASNAERCSLHFLIQS